jgi:hypothetical protein
MPPNTAPQRPSVPVGSVRNLKINAQGQLDSGELFTAVLITEVTTSDLTITGKAVSTSTMTVNEDDAVLAGQGFICTVSGMLVANSPYKLKIVGTTDGSQTIVGYVIFLVADE